ncbi:YbjN domain-containing protein [Actinoplanes sp. NPDC049118]|uniref:YbjN domain-containing protein n=1 Tax=Actinoplanes sp. NPDC049118 TaxID=3155769 RepID=UPI0033C7AF7D
MRLFSGQPAKAFSKQMIKEALTAHGINFLVDDDGELVTTVQGSPAFFFRVGQLGEMLQLRVMVMPPFDVDDVPMLYRFCNGWNHDNLWPKAYVHVSDNGLVNVVGDYVVDWEKGVTAEQLEHALMCGLVGGGQLVDSVAELRDAPKG